MRIPQWGRLLWERLGETMYQPPPLLPPRFTLPTIPPPFPPPSSHNTLPTSLPPPIYITSSHNPSYHTSPPTQLSIPSPILTLVLLPLPPISTFETVGRNNVYQPPFLLSTIATPPPSDITFLTPPPFPPTPPPNLPQQQSPSMYKTLPRSPLPPTLTSSPEFLSPPISIRMVRI